MINRVMINFKSYQNQAMGCEIDQVICIGIRNREIEQNSPAKS